MQKSPSAARSPRPRAVTVFAAAFVAGAAAAVGINRAVDVHMAQAKPQVECEPIFVALRALPPGTPVTIWDVALRDWPKAMLPTTALRADDRFEGMILKHPLREGQPLLSLQLVKAPDASSVEQAAESYVPARIEPASVVTQDADLWGPTAAPIAVNKVVPPQPAAPIETVAISTPPAQPEAEPIVPAPSETVTQPVVEATAPPAAAAAEDVGAVVGPVASAADVAAIMPSDPPPSETVTAPVQSEQAGVVPPENDVAPATTTPPSTEAVAVVEPVPAGVESALPTPSGTPPIRRYLVVPERIAAQADASFTSPAPQQPAAPIQPAETTATRVEQQASATTAPATQQPPAGPSRRAAAGQARRPASSPPPGNNPPARKSGAVPRVAQAPTLETHPNTEPTETTTVWDSMFPNIRAGINALKKN